MGEQKETNEQVTSCCDRAAPGEKILKSEWKFLISERLPEFLKSWCQYDERVARILRHDLPSLDTGLQSLVCGVRVTSLTPATGSSPAGRHGSGISPRTALILPCAGACER